MHRWGLVCPEHPRSVHDDLPAPNPLAGMTRCSSASACTRCAAVLTAWPHWHLPGWCSSHCNSPPENSRPPWPLHLLATERSQSVLRSCGCQICSAYQLMAVATAVKRNSSSWTSMSGPNFDSSLAAVAVRLLHKATRSMVMARAI